MKHLLYFLLFIICHLSCTPTSEEPFTIYLVRHAEKDVSDKTNSDPTLTPCGEERAESLAVFFDQVALEKVYSSDYIRTKDTANPTAESKNKDLTLYNPGELNTIAQVLLERKENALVVGHSNTTGVLAGLLCDQKIEPFDESIYNRIYQVVISDKTPQLQVFHTAFSCE
ncbi:MAG: phosphoglycerate mutase family protein [Reichenbachiella sp.]|uniref:SixA phosphatase family protein n=1 Tax=Reichenbachiella sp. TaxID=2184521 RepID=UPI0029674AD4|nr:phosphoglycerate mutase family protein [Reichenbachiella sp.]MDW3209856.1 phosphoglycerate mutase family protein [Reichenbachiella sp.]